MGVNINAILPPHVTVSNVSKVIGAAAGLKTTLDAAHDSIFAEVEGLTVRDTGVVGMCAIEMETPDEFVDGEKNHFVHYHFEMSDGPIPSDYGCVPQFWGCKLLLPKSTPFWCAVMYKVVNFFGGWILYQDCDDEPLTFFPFQENINPVNGEPWKDMQRRIHAIEPITEKDLEEFQKVAAYEI